MRNLVAPKDVPSPEDRNPAAKDLVGKIQEIGPAPEAETGHSHRDRVQARGITDRILVESPGLNRPAPIQAESRE